MYDEGYTVLEKTCEMYIKLFTVGVLLRIYIQDNDRSECLLCGLRVSPIARRVPLITSEIS